MGQQTTEHFLVTVCHDTQGQTNDVTVHKLSIDPARLQDCMQGQAKEFIINDQRAVEIAGTLVSSTAASMGTEGNVVAMPVATAATSAPPAPPAAGATTDIAWRTMPGGWATLAAAGGAALTSHGAYPLHDGIARVEAGKIIPPTTGLSYTSMPGGWASLTG